MAIHDYESWGFRSDHTDRVTPVLLESYSGTEIVAWYGNIERQIQNLVQAKQAERNYTYADKLRQFLATWRNNQISGSINRETLDPLEAAAAQLAVDPWKMGNYFSNLRDSIRKLIASEEELPRAAAPAPPADMGGGGGGIAPPSNDFGAQDEEPGAGGPGAPGGDETGAPSDLPGGNPPGAPGAPGTPPGAPGAPAGGAAAPPPQGQPTAV